RPVATAAAISPSKNQNKIAVLRWRPAAALWLALCCLPAWAQALPAANPTANTAESASASPPPVIGNAAPGTAAEHPLPPLLAPSRDRLKIKNSEYDVSRIGQRQVG